MIRSSCYRNPEKDLTSQGTTVRFWLEEYAFSEGETALLREQIKVEALLTVTMCCLPRCQVNTVYGVLFLSSRPPRDVQWFLARP